MATTTNIPLVTLPVGSQVFGPHTPAVSETSITLSIDRTVAGGLNTLTAASGIAVLAEMSTDGGATWHATDTDQPGTATSWTAVGGLYPDRHGVNAAVSSATWFLFPGASRRLRATITVSGPSSIAVAGSLVTA